MDRNRKRYGRVYGLPPPRVATMDSLPVPKNGDVTGVYIAFWVRSKDSSDGPAGCEMWVRELLVTPGVWHVEFLFTYRHNHPLSFGVIGQSDAKLQFTHRTESFFTKEWKFFQLTKQEETLDRTHQRVLGNIHRWCKTHTGIPLDRRALAWNFLLFCCSVDPLHADDLDKCCTPNCVQPVVEAVYNATRESFPEDIYTRAHVITPRELYQIVIGESAQYWKCVESVASINREYAKKQKKYLRQGDSQSGRK